MSVTHHTVVMRDTAKPTAFRVRVTGGDYAVCAVMVDGVGRVGQEAAALGEKHAVEIRAELVKVSALPPLWTMPGSPVHDIEHNGITYVVQVLDPGKPARLHGHPDSREPEEPVEWCVIAGEDDEGVALATLTLDAEETEAIHTLITEEVRS